MKFLHKNDFPQTLKDIARMDLSVASVQARKAQKDALRIASLNPAEILRGVDDRYDKMHEEDWHAGAFIFLEDMISDDCPEFFALRDALMSHEVIEDVILDNKGHTNYGNSTIKIVLKDLRKPARAPSQSTPHPQTSDNPQNAAIIQTLEANLQIILTHAVKIKDLKVDPAILTKVVKQATDTLSATELSINRSPLIKANHRLSVLAETFDRHTRIGPLDKTAITELQKCFAAVTHTINIETDRARKPEQIRAKIERSVLLDLTR
jgi:hypothetical protein